MPSRASSRCSRRARRWRRTPRRSRSTSSPPCSTDPTGSSACTSSTPCRPRRSSRSCGARHPTASLVDDAREWVRAIGKTPIVVADAPGFASSRLGVALGLEAIRMLEDGVASAEDIDAAMTLGYKHPVGPLRLTDIVGPRCAARHRRVPRLDARRAVRAARAAAAHGRRGQARPQGRPGLLHMGRAMIASRCALRAARPTMEER